jgi:hypothetical protein
MGHSNSPGSSGASGRQGGPRRWGRAQADAIEDPYKLTKKRSEPAVCPQCGAVYRNGRWQWGEAPQSADKAVCQACHRINDRYPAGELTLAGAFLETHKAEILGLARHQEEAERSDHPLNRIMDIDEKVPGQIVITTTDIHLPRRIGEALHRAYHGTLHADFDNQGYFIRVTWRRDV